MGKFVVLEGADGAGKTFVRDMISKEMKDKFIVTREPGSLINNGVCEDIRRIIMSYDINSETEALLFAASRSEHVREIQELLKIGFNVVSDRYVYSSMVYQGITGELGLERIIMLNKFAPKPDLIIFLNVDESTAIERMQARDDSNRMDEVFMKRSSAIIKAYRGLFKGIQSAKIDANKPKEIVWGQVKKILEEL